MMSLVRSTLEGMLHETALDMTRLGQRMAGKALTARPVPFMSADIQYPQPDPTAEIAQDAVLSGQIYVRRNAQVGNGVVLRGDNGVVDVGANARIGDGSVVLANTRTKDHPFARAVRIGPNATIGSRVVLNNCRIEKGAVIGDECKIGEGAIVEEGAMLEKGTVIPAGHFVPKETRWGGNPAKFLGQAHSDHH